MLLVLLQIYYRSLEHPDVSRTGYQPNGGLLRGKVYRRIDDARNGPQGLFDTGNAGGAGYTFDIEFLGIDLGVVACLFDRAEDRLCVRRSSELNGVARSVAGLTFAEATPGTAAIAFSTRRTHEAHVMPSMPKSVATGREEDFSIWANAIMARSSALSKLGDFL